MNTEKITSILNRARTLGSEILESNGMYLIKTSEFGAMLLIPDNVKNIIKNNSFFDFYPILKGNYNLKVIGGCGLTRTDYLFSECCLKSIDMTEFHWDNVQNTKYMFGRAKIDVIKLGVINGESLLDISNMFEQCTAQSVSLNIKNAHRLSEAKSLFTFAIIDNINIIKFECENVHSLSKWFDSCEVNTIDIDGLDTSNIKDMSSMFFGADIAYLDISKFNMAGVSNLYKMLSYCKIQRLKMFDISQCFGYSDTQRLFDFAEINHVIVGSEREKNVYKSPEFAKIAYHSLIRSVELDGESTYMKI